MDARLVGAARDGDQDALEDLVGRAMPLVYNIVGRAMPGRADIDDVVQETMLRVVRGLPGLRDDNAFRSWLVSVTMNQIRQHYRSRPTSSIALEDFSLLADPGADFVDLTLTQLGLSGQRRETVEATRWLDEDDRELLSLWWLVVAGHLTRAEMVDAIGLSAQTVTVRVSRMKAQLETSRLVVRALQAAPRCPELSQVVQLWEGQPSPLWRKRIARHLRQCDYCGALGEDLIAPEKLLAGLALVPLPLGYAPHLLAQHVAAGAAGAAAASTPSATTGPALATSRRSSHARGHSTRHVPRSAAGKLLAVVAVVATIAGAWVVATRDGSNGGTHGTPAPASATTPAASPVVSSPTRPPNPTPSSSRPVGTTATPTPQLPKPAAVTRLRIKSTGRCMQTAGQAGAEPYEAVCTGSANQTWELVRNAVGRLQLRNQASKLCLTYPSQLPDGAVVRASTCGAQASGQWWDYNYSQHDGVIAFSPQGDSLRRLGDNAWNLAGSGKPYDSTIGITVNYYNTASLQFLVDGTLFS
ncbi:sigma-70 family RNA polymerase sigma factor [Catenulispora sp. MAP5-51]|uniref:sigma-70 family RNA polymerase sigma factor n=1 Tax=Catenulispora sp. MAP5-51 TaxID=3156298 RepID=UPI0035148612